MFLWKNWGGNQECYAQIIYPQNEYELIDFIQKIKNENVKVHAFGSRHSWSDIVCAKDYLIDIQNLNEIISIDKKNKIVRVQAGIKLNKLNQILAENNLALKNQAQITNQTLSGAVCTGTHGSGKSGTFASFIKEVKLLAPTGITYNISETENSHLLGASKTNIGTLGIVLEYELECRTLFKTKQEYLYCDWQTILQEYENLLNTNDFMEFSYHIKDDSVKIRVNNIVDPNTPNTQNIDYGFNNLTGSLLLNYLPSPGSLYFEEEIAIPRRNFLEVAQEFKNFLKKSFSKHEFLHVLFRFANAEKNNWLIPTSEQDVVYFSITTLAQFPFEDLFKDFYDLMLRHNGRPHWAKLNYLTKEDVQKLYGQNYENFVKVRTSLDPNLIFSTDFTKRIFGN